MKYLFLFLIPMLIAPASWAQISVRSALAEDRIAAPGASYVSSLVLSNDTDEVQQFKVYQTDYHFWADGRNAFDPAGSHPRSNAEWIEFDIALGTLQPRESREISYAVRVPEMISEPGTYWSMLMVEAIPPGALESTLTDEDGPAPIGMRQLTRYGVQIATHVTGAEADLAFDQVALVPGAEGGLLLMVDLVNHGGLMVRPEMGLELFASDGSAMGRRDGSRQRIYPGTSVRQQFDLSDLSPGQQYEAFIIVDAGEGQLVGAQYTLDL